MTDLPLPLVAEDVDIRDFPYMPLDVVRLRDSDIATKAKGDEFRCAVLLWCAAWHQIPAASLPDDDDVLSQYAGFGRVVREWKKIKAGALRGWIKCSDGRLYHPVVAEKANDAWRAKLEQRWRTECARMKKHMQRHSMSLTIPDFEVWMSQGCPQGHPLPVPETTQHCPQGQTHYVPGETHSKRSEGKGREGISKPSTLQPASTIPTGAGLDDTPLALASTSRSAILSKALRAEGIDSQPADPRLIAMADQGVTAETLQAAAAEAKRAKPGERIPVGYVIGIVERWAKDAAGVAASGATKPVAKMGGRQAAISNYAAQAAAARGESNERAASSERDITGESVRIA